MVAVIGHLPLSAGERSSLSAREVLETATEVLGGCVLRAASAEFKRMGVKRAWNLACRSGAISAVVGCTSR